MLISIIIPVFNTKLYLDKCISSVLSQSYHNFECILVDDGSNDGSSDICDKWAKIDNRIIVIHQLNKGVSIARNIGIQHANGKYIYFMDSDDFIIDTEMFFNFISTIKNHGNLDLIVQNFSIQYNRKQQSYIIPNNKINISETLYWDKNSDLIYNYYKKGIMFVLWNKLFSKEIISTHNISFKVQYMEDFRFILDYLIHCRKIHFQNFNGYCYNKYEQFSLSKERSIKMFNDYIEMHKYIISVFSNISIKDIDESMWPHYQFSILKLIHNKNNYNSLSTIMKNEYIIRSKNNYKPVSISDHISHYLISNSKWSLYKSYRKVIHFFKHD